MKYKREYHIRDLKTDSIPLARTEEFEGSKSKCMPGFRTGTNLARKMLEVIVMCKHCTALHQIELKAESISTVVNKSPSLISTTLLPALSSNIEIEYCADCGTKHPGTVILDFHMAPKIAAFNYKGYKTAASCESHYTEDTSRCYVLFEGKEILNYVDCLPDSWTVDWMFYKRYGKVMITAAEYGGGDRYKRETLRDLYEFALQIPSTKK